MDYANILVPRPTSARPPRPDTARRRPRRRFEADLTGTAAHPVPAPILVRDVYDAIDQEGRNKAQVQAILEQAHASFERFTGDGIRTDWRPSFAEATAHLNEQARAADLVVVSRRGPGDEDPGPLGVLPGPVLMEAGRPVLVVPPRTAHLKASRIVIAWKDGPEARRAVSPALPLMREADRVFVRLPSGGCGT